VKFVLRVSLTGFLAIMQFYGFDAEKLGALNVNPKFLDRNINEGFSGGEKK